MSSTGDIRDRLNREEEIFVCDLHGIVHENRQKAYSAVCLSQVVTNWLIGRRIVEQEQQGKTRASYGKRVIAIASQALTEEFGKGYSETNLRCFRKFYIVFQNVTIQQAMPAKSAVSIQQTLPAESLAQTSQELQDLSAGTIMLPANLSWTHYERLIRVEDEKARLWYMYEASKEQWDYRTLARNIASQYYYRMMQTPEAKRVEVVNEMHCLTAKYEQHKLEYLKNPVVAEFLGLPQDISFTESNLESAILSHLQRFIMEMGKGYAFVARQQHIKTDMGDYYIDLVFYNYILKCFLLIDLKTSQITYQDVGQMDLYVRMYDELKCTEGDNPTIGLVLCSETSSDLARFSILKDNKQIFMAKYLTYLPSEEQLRREIEEQKAIFALKTANNT